jgi:hypothetical protein
MSTTIRAAVLALLIGSVGIVAASAATETATEPTSPTTETPGVVPTVLLDLTFDGAVIPEDLVGVLFSRKRYPTDQEIVYGAGFIPPNTFIRHVESGSLGIRPRSETEVIRAGHTQADAEVVAAGAEAIVGSGDTFIQRDVPWHEYGSEALGEMWTPGEDVVIFSLAIRERSRCCAMSHQGMVSRWYHTLSSGVQELSDSPLRFRVQRWELPAGESMAVTAAMTPTLWAVGAGMIEACPAEPPSPDRDGCSASGTNSPIWSLSLSPGSEMVLTNTDGGPAVLYELVVEPAEVA